MALLTFPSSETQKIQPTKHTSSRTKKHQQNPKPKPKSKPKHQNPPPSSWDQFKNLLTCKQMDVVGSNKVHQDQVKNPNGYSKLNSCSSICSFRDVVHGNTRVVHRADNSPESSSVGINSGLISRKKQSSGGGSSSSSKTLSGSVRSNGVGSYTSCSKGMQFRKLSGCYECRAIVDPSRYTIPRSTICVCSQCGEVFPKMESLEHHQAVRHAAATLKPPLALAISGVFRRGFSGVFRLAFSGCLPPPRDSSDLPPPTRDSSDIPPARSSSDAQVLLPATSLLPPARSSSSDAQV